ncbi:MAG: hypothetical protein AB7U85_02950 [Alphaproteobacteria bacterium]
MNKKIIIIALMIFSFMAKNVFAAVGCDLSNPDRDVKKFFPQSSGYKTSYESVEQNGGEELFAEVQKRFGDNFTGLFETIDVPYSVYTIFQGNEVIGYIHGVNQRATYGGMQVFLAFDKEGIIKDFYFQRLTSQASKELRSKDFANQFIGLSLKDFADYDVKSGVFKGIYNPVLDAQDDFIAALRGVKKNLILMDIFVFSRGKK